MIARLGAAVLAVSGLVVFLRSGDVCVRVAPQYEAYDPNEIWNGYEGYYPY